MKNKKTMLIVGGDLRQVYLANRFSEEYNILALGLDNNAAFGENVTVITDISDQISCAEFLVLPMPAMENESFVNAPFYSGKIEATKLLQKLPSTATVFAGKITAPLLAALNAKGLDYFDYLTREELAVANAAVTAEGALQIIMEELPVTVSGLNCLIIGAGRISKVLRHLLNSVGANVSVSARKCSDLAWIKAERSTPIHNSRLKEKIGDFDLIVNTVPATLLTEDILKNVDKNALLLDLASKPGGIDFDVAKQLGLKTIWALSLPGKVAPLTAGEIIYSTVCNILEEGRVSYCE